MRWFEHRKHWARVVVARVTSLRRRLRFELTALRSARFIIAGCAALSIGSMLRASAAAAPLPQSALEEAAGDIQKSKAAEACTILREYLKTHAPNARAWNLLGVAEAERKHSTEAEGAFRTALKLDARLLAANENLGLLLFQKSDFAGAARIIENWRVAAVHSRLDKHL